MPGKFWTTCVPDFESTFGLTQLDHAQALGGEAAGAQGQLWSCAEVGGPMPTVSATAPATATRRPPSPILTHRLRWRIAAHLVGDEVFTFGRPRCLYCKRGQLQGRKVRPPPASSLLGLPEPPLLSSPPSRLRRSSYPRYQSSLRSSDDAGPAVPGRHSTNGPPGHRPAGPRRARGL